MFGSKDKKFGSGFNSASRFGESRDGGESRRSFSGMKTGDSSFGGGARTGDSSFGGEARRSSSGARTGGFGGERRDDNRTEEKRKAIQAFHEGQVIEGTVKNITHYGAFVDIGGVDGLLHITDMSWSRVGHPSEVVTTGETIKVKVLLIDEQSAKVSLGLKQLLSSPWDTIESKYPAHTKLTGKITNVTEYGVFVEIEKGIEGLVHISEVSVTERISSLEQMFMIDEAIDVVVIAVDKDRRRMSLSVKQLV